MGLETGAALMIGSMAAGALSSYGATQQNKQSLNYSSAENEKSRAWSEKMYGMQLQDAREDFQTQNQAARENALYQNTLSKDLSDYIYRNFSSPEAQVKAFSKAGINPAAVLGSNGSGFGQQGSSVLTPSFRGGSAPSSSMVGLPQLSNPYSGMQEMVPAISSSIQSLADANLKGAETDKLLTLLPAELQSILLENHGVMLTNQFQEMFNANYEAFGSKEMAAKVNSLESEAYLNWMRGDTEAAQAKLNEALEYYQNIQNTVEGQFAMLKAGLTVKLLEQQIETEKSKQDFNYSSAKESRATAAFTSYQLSFQKALEANRLDEAISTATKAANDAFISEEELRIIKYAVAEARVRADHAEELFWKDFIMDIFTRGTDAVIGFKNAKSWNKMSDASQRNVQRKIDEMHLVNETQSKGGENNH